MAKGDFWNNNSLGERLAGAGAGTVAGTVGGPAGMLGGAALGFFKPDVTTLGLTDQFGTARKQKKEGELREDALLANRPLYEDALNQQKLATEDLTGKLDDLSGKSGMLAQQGLPQESLDYYTDMANRSVNTMLAGNSSRRMGTAGIVGAQRNVLDNYRNIMSMDAEQRLRNQQQDIQNQANFIGQESNLQTNLVNQMGLAEQINEIDFFKNELGYARDKQAAGDMNRMGAWRDTRELGMEGVKAGAQILPSVAKLIAAGG